jgi:hypothetical protein
MNIKKNNIWIMSILFSILASIFSVGNLSALVDIPSNPADITDNLTQSSSVDTSNMNILSKDNAYAITLSPVENYYYLDESINIHIVGNSFVDTSSYLEISIVDDPTYTFQYLGLLDDSIVFIPQKPGTYIINLFSQRNNVAVLLSHVTFVVRETSPSTAFPNPSATIDNASSELSSDDAISSNGVVDNATDSGNHTVDVNTSLVKYSKFKGATTDFEKHYINVSSLRKLPNVTLERPGVGRIHWNNSLNVLKADLDSNIQILPGKISVRSEILDSSFNSSATLTIYGLSMEDPIILKNDHICVECQLQSYSDGVLTFDVKGFSNYTVVENTSLSIWNTNEHSESLYNDTIIKYVGQNITFYANYSDISDGVPIIDADCSISFSNDVSSSFPMIYNGVIGVYVYTNIFTNNDTYKYNITCNKTGFRTLNLSEDVVVESAGDLAISNENIYFSNQYPVENENITIYANIYNLVDYNYTDVLVRFYDGNPASNLISNATVIGDVYLSINGVSSAVVNTSWISKVGVHDIYVLIDPENVINDLDRTNNKADNVTSTSIWQIYYGQVTSLANILGSTTGETANVFVNWSINTNAPVTIYVASTESDINWASLKAISRNTSGDQNAQTLDDFTDIDLSLGLENYSDSINATYTSNGYPTVLSNYTVHDMQIENVPEAMSTNNTNFYTGILWDSNDTVLPYYSYQENPSSRPDIVFVTKVNYNQIGTYGIYDYELRVPAFLRDYKGENSGVVQFYYEIY